MLAVILRYIITASGDYNGGKYCGLTTQFFKIAILENNN
jgi:hypothetical protein